MTEFLNLLLPWKDAPNDQISDIFVYFILLSFIILLGYFLWETFFRCRLIDSLTKELQKFSRPAQPQIKQELKEKFAHNNELAEAWREFEDSLITRKRNENQEVVYKTDEASLFFSEDRLLEHHLNLRFWNSVPALLVGFGILGTFVGLVWGLIPFSGIDFTQTDQIQSAIKELLSGVSTAFVTSVWGMLTSLVFNWLEKRRISRVNRAITNLQRALDQLFTLTTQEEIAIQQEVELEQQTAALKSFSTDLADKIKIAMEPSLDNLKTAVEGLRQQKEESSADAIGKLIKEFQNSLSASTVTQMEELAQTVGAAAQSLKNLPDQMKEMITGVQKQINQTHQLLGATSAEQTDQMKKMFGETLEVLKEANQDAIAAQSKTADVVNEKMRQIATQTAAESAKAREQMSKQVEQAAAQLSGSVQNAEQSVSKILQLLEPQIKAFDKQIDNSRETLAGGRKLLQEMNASAASVGQVIETTKEFSDQLMTGADQLESAGLQLTRASNTFNQENEKYLAANREATLQIQNTLDQSKQVLNEFTQRFKTIEEGLNGIFAEIEKGLNTYATTSRESINEYLGAFSDHLSSAANALAGSVEALDENVENLNDLIERRR